MNLLFVNYEYPPIGGGAANATFFLAKSFHKFGHKVVVLTTGYKDIPQKTIENGVIVYRLSCFRKTEGKSRLNEMILFIIKAVAKSSQIAEKENIQNSIAFFTIPSGIVTLWLKITKKIPYIVSLRGGDVPGHVPELAVTHKMVTPLRRSILRHATVIIANSNELKNKSIKYDQYPVVVINNGVDIDFFCKPVNVVKQQPFIFLFVGRLHPEKNLTLLINQFSKFIKKHTAILYIVGDGEDKANLINQAKICKCDDFLKFLGWQNKKQLKEIYQNSSALIIPSFYEGSSNVILEAMACGLPVIASDIPGNREIITHKLNGLLFDLNKSDDLIDQMILLFHDFNLCNQLTINAEKLVHHNYSWDISSAKYLYYFR